MVLFVAREEAEEVMKITSRYYRSKVIGEVSVGEGIVLRTHRGKVLHL